MLSTILATAGSAAAYAGLVRRRSLRSGRPGGDTSKSNFRWLLSEPSAVELHPGTRNLTVSPAGKTDLWSNTYYTPLLKRSNAPLYARPVPRCETWNLSVEFELAPVKQFDQAGGVIYLNADNWIKCGIEFVDGAPRLSVVVTRDGWSDWSTQSWSGCSARLRVTQTTTGAYVVEAAESSADAAFEFVRICQLTSKVPDAESPDVYAGVYACCPVAQCGCSATFQNLEIGEGSPFQHHAGDTDAD